MLNYPYLSSTSSCWELLHQQINHVTWIILWPLNKLVCDLNEPWSSKGGPYISCMQQKLLGIINIDSFLKSNKTKIDKALVIIVYNKYAFILKQVYPGITMPLQAQVRRTIKHLGYRVLNENSNFYFISSEVWKH